MVHWSITSYCEPFAAIPDYGADAHPRYVRPYEEVLIEQQWARHPPDPYKSSATSEPEWIVQWGILMCLVIQRFFA